MKLIIGLGNPGAKYDYTRHNTGFATLNAVADTYSGNWQDKPKLQGQLTQLVIGSEQVLFLKPQTFYNESGQSARAVRDFYKLDNSDILVIHDELALPFGSIRTRLGGSDAGNNGIKSMNAHLGEDYARVRVGVWQEIRNNQNDVDFVLGRFNKAEAESFSDIIEQTQKIIENFAADIFEATSYKL